MSDSEERVKAVMIAAVEHHQSVAGQVKHARRKQIAIESRAFVAMYDAIKNFDANRTTARDMPAVRFSSDKPDKPDNAPQFHGRELQDTFNECRALLDAHRARIDRMNADIATVEQVLRDSGIEELLQVDMSATEQLCWSDFGEEWAIGYRAKNGMEMLALRRPIDVRMRMGPHLRALLLAAAEHIGGNVTREGASEP